MSSFSRRGLLKAGTTLAAALAIEPLTGCPAPDPGPADVKDLDVRFTTMTLAGYPVRLRTYGDSIPGPILRTKPGATLSVRIRNHLPFYDSSAWHHGLAGLPEMVHMNVPHMLNTTNLHVHGMAVIPHLFEPVGTADPSSHMIAIQPGEEKLYSFTLPEDHPAGLYWYHPHHHGSTAVQVQNGMAGAIIVEGAIDEVPEIAAAKEYLIAVQDLGLFPSKSEPVVWSYDPPQNAIYNTFTGTSSIMNGQGEAIGPADSGFSTGDFPLRLFLVNGEPVFQETHNSNPGDETKPIGAQLGVPRYTLRPGEVVRFRMLNGCSDNLIPLVVEGHTMHLIALDGINFPAPRPRPYPGTVDAKGNAQGQVLLPSGGRAEFLIQGSATPGIYRIMQLEQNQQFLASQQKVLAEIEISGDPVTMALPTSLPVPARHYPLIKPEEVQNRRSITFDMMFPAHMNKVVNIDFSINGEMYDETAVPVVVKLGTVEEWTIQDNGAVHGGSTEGHPFHLHTNSFEVIKIGDQEVEPGTILDTVWVPHGVPVVIRVRFKEWTGKAVFHCHIIPHEDAGMMQNVLFTS